MPYGVSSIYRYPVKGFTPEQLATVTLVADAAIPGDRAYAFALAETPFDATAPDWMPKTQFLMLQRDERLAELTLSYDPTEPSMVLSRADGEIISAPTANAGDARPLEAFLRDFMGLAASPRLVSAPGHSFSDHRNQVVSFINLRSIEALEAKIGQPIDPLRFRANVYFEGDRPWQEFEWLGETMNWGGAALEVTSRIVRCAATNVDPATAQRDLNIPKTLQQAFGHVDMGIYARVKSGGPVSTTDPIDVSQPSGR